MLTQIKNSLKSIFLPYTQDQVDKFCNQIIINCKHENWFKISYSSEDDFNRPILNTIPGSSNKDKFEIAITSICYEVRTAILKAYLIENSYVDKLLLKRKQLIFKDAYGDWNFDSWIDELKKFCNNRISKISSFVNQNTPVEIKDFISRSSNNTNYYLNYPDNEIVELWIFIDEILDSFIDEDNSHAERSITDEISPYEYESIIAEMLCKLGWDAYPTKGSGDQGADVIAEKHGVKVVVQCKLYNQPVGNKAVQEVSSARDYYQASAAIVVTNNDYTKSARQLAETQNVLLLHDSQLEDWSKGLDLVILKENDDEV